MPTHDYVIANGTGSSVRSDINDALAAIVSQNSSSTAPATTYAYMIWVDTTTNIVKMRNGANSAWIELFETDGEFGSKTFNGNVTLNAQGDLRFADSDSSNWLAFQAPATVASNVTWTLPNADGTSGQTLQTNGSGTLSWVTPSATVDKIEEGNTSAEVVDTGSDGHFKVTTEGTERLRITAAGNVGVGTTSPSKELHVYKSSGTTTFWLESGDTQKSIAAINIDNNSYAFQSTYNTGGTAPRPFVWNSVSTEQMRLDTSGRLLLGTSTSRDVASGGPSIVQIEGSSFRHLSMVQNSNDDNGVTLAFGKSRGTSAGGTTIVQNNDDIARLRFAGANGSDVATVAAEIRCSIDGTPGTSNDMPGRLVFSTTADGASSPTERMRIDNAGRILAGKTTTSIGTAGLSVGVNDVGTTKAGVLITTVDGEECIYLNRLTSDGTLISFRQDGTQEGTISVSGTTVSYNGAHLSRWSQLPSGQERTEILRGTVLSNIDEMCEWGEEENEQLNRMKVSDVEGDKNVSGVFQGWDDDDDTYENDFYCAMTGDFIIRIAEGVTVERGDLLMSAGDGTAKPQDDDIIRSKTIAKVTSTNVSCTYEDGSYCVPCVLMAC